MFEFDTGWEWLRGANFIILFACFMVMIHKGVHRYVVDPDTLDWARMMNLVWTTLALYSIGEVLYQVTGGGPRVMLQTAVALLQLYVAVCKTDKAIYRPKCDTPECRNPRHEL